jgi:hypothetical protein
MAEQEDPDLIAKKLFVITIVCTVMFVGAAAFIVMSPVQG